LLADNSREERERERVIVIKERGLSEIKRRRELEERSVYLRARNNIYIYIGAGGGF